MGAIEEGAIRAKLCVNCSIFVYVQMLNGNMYAAQKVRKRFGVHCSYGDELNNQTTCKQYCVHSGCTLCAILGFTYS